MRVALVVNPFASSVTPRLRVLIQRALSTHHEVVATETRRRGHATQLAESAASDGVDVVVALGGDGTLNEVANGLAHTGTALGALPGGSTNVFARTIGMTNDPLDATTELLDALASDNRKLFSLGRANQRYFLFHVGAGFDAAVVEAVESRGSLKRYAGQPLFVWSTLLTWAKLGPRSKPRFEVTFDDGTPVPGYLTICLNSNPYTFFGNRALNVAPWADFGSGMAVLTVKSLKFPTFGNIMASSMLFSGHRLRRHPKADLRGDVSHCEIKGFGKFPYQLDGEYLGDVDNLSLNHESEALDVFIPRH
jgi:diacylglycerol kinase family enzyme